VGPNLGIKVGPNLVDEPNAEPTDDDEDEDDEDERRVGGRTP